jgi:hypothetical protein
MIECAIAALQPVLAADGIALEVVPDTHVSVDAGRASDANPSAVPVRSSEVMS